MRAPRGQRRVVVKARVVRHAGYRFAAAPLARHLAYLQRDGVTRDDRAAELFDAGDPPADGPGFADRCAGDRHHFRFIVSPEDAAEMTDLRAFTRELMADMAADLGTALDWVGVDHWNTDNPHVHVLVRGKTDRGDDLVIDRNYIREGLRHRAAQRVTLELGLRTQREIDRALAREVAADRWTSLDGRLRRMADRNGGLADLRLDPGKTGARDVAHLVGRAATLEKMGLARRILPGCWTLAAEMEPTLRELAVRGDIIRSMHRRATDERRSFEPGRLVIHLEEPGQPIVGRLVDRGLSDELTGAAYAVVDGVDGHLHHLRFRDLDATGDASAGAIVELRTWAGRRGQSGQALRICSDLALEDQIVARGATWLDRELVALEPVRCGTAFGQEVEAAKLARARHLVELGLAEPREAGFAISRNLLATLRSSELGRAADEISQRTGLPYQARTAGQQVAGTYRERIQLASGRFAMIDEGAGFSLVPWRPALDRHLGALVRGTVSPSGGIEWALTRSRGIAR